MAHDVTITSGVSAQSNVHVHVYDVATAIDAAADAGMNWRDMSKRERRAAVEGFGTLRETAHTSNATCVALHEDMARALVPTERGELPDPDVLAFGDGTSSFTSSDTSLNNRVGEIGITDPTNDGTTWLISEYVDSLELNGETLAELGVVSSDGGLWNHSPMPNAIDKTTASALTVNVEIPMSDHP